MRNRLRLAWLCLAFTLASCGDGTFIVIINSGVIVGSPRCDISGGEFDLREEMGLVLVIITDGTDIVIGGSFGRCSDLAPGVQVDVEGSQRGHDIVATRITVVD